MSDLKDREPDVTLDVRGEICPYPQLYTRKKLEKMKVGEVLEVLTDHPPAAEETIPGMCAQKGYPCIVDKRGDVYTLKILKRKE